MTDFVSLTEIKTGNIKKYKSIDAREILTNHSDEYELTDYVDNSAFNFANIILQESRNKREKQLKEVKSEQPKNNQTKIKKRRSIK